MFYDQSDDRIPVEEDLFRARPCVVQDCGEGAFLAPGAPLALAPAEGSEESVPSRRGSYEREVVESVWAFAEVVPGIDPDLWRRDEFGAWIRRLDYGRRDSAYGWEIFDPGVGRRTQGVYAMRPMQWHSYVRQYEAFA